MKNADENNNNEDKVVRVIHCKNGVKIEVMNNDINVETMARFLLGLPQIHITENNTEKETDFN